MRQLLIDLISIYQQLISPFFKHLFGLQAFCRYSPTCSVYAQQAIREHGAVKGTVRAVKRLLRCQPFSKNYGYS